MTAFTQDKINVAQILENHSARKENYVGNGKNSDYQHFILFPQCFLMSSSTALCFYPITLSQTSPWLYVSAYKSFENTVGKGEISCSEQFLLFQQCFLPFWKTFCHFINFKIVVCKLSQFGRV